MNKLVLTFVAVLFFWDVTGTCAQSLDVEETLEAQETIDVQGTQEITEVEAMVVTAQKREENPKDIPISMDVLSDIQLEDAFIRNTEDLVKFSPNVFIKQTHVEHALVIRGISSFTVSTYSPAGFYVDDVSYPLHYMQNTDFFDVERIEILKGPQGTLYGRNSESGVLNIVTRQPGNESEANVSGEYASDDTYRFTANLKEPIVSDTLFFGGAFQFYTSDGYTQNLSNGDDTVMDWEHLSGRGTLRWTPSDAWDISLISDIQSYEDHGGGYRYLDGPYATNEYEVQHDTDEYLNQDSNSQNLRVKYNAATFDILSVTSVLDQAVDKQNDSDLWNDATSQIQNTFKIDVRQLAQELRIASDGQGAFEWLAGVYGFVEDTRFDYQKDIVSSSTTSMHPVTDIDSSGCAAFTQGTYTLFKKLHLTAGLRFDHQEMDGQQYDDARNTSNDETLTFDELLPKVSLSYDIAPDVMGYVSSSKGYLVGGLNWLTSSTDDAFTYDSEYTWNYETGIKAAFFSGKLISNISLFYIDITDKQVAEYDSTASTQTITNAAKAHSQGVELQVQAKPITGLELFAGFGYTKSTFDEFLYTSTSSTEEDYSGNDLTYAPRYTYNLGAQYRFSQGLFCRADFFGTDRFYGDAANTVSQSSYETLNLKLGYEHDRFDLCVYLKNVFDQHYLTYINSYGNYTIGLDGDPRVIGLTANIRF